MSQLIGDAQPQNIIAADDRRLMRTRDRRVLQTEARDLLWTRSRILNDQGWLEAVWYEWPTPGGGGGPAGVSFAYTLTPTVGGTIYSRPRITITIPNAGTDYGITRIRILNTTANPDQEFVVSRAFVPGDVLVIDSDTFICQVNGVPADFSGQFITLDPRLGSTNSIVIYALATDAPSLTPLLEWTSRFAA